jgi:capsular polysaccharide biosynthesis protein
LSLQSSDYIYCARPFHDFHRILYKKLGLDEQNTIFASKTSRIKFDTVIALSFPGIKSLHPPWIASFMINTFLDKPLPDSNRRLYISRRGYKRQIINEKDVMSLLARYNFEIIDPLSVKDQHRLFAGAKILISIHGSALANIVFCQPGTSIIDLMPEDHVTSFAYSLAESGGLNYYCLVCDNPVKRPAGSAGPSYYDFYVDTRVLENTIKSLL